MCVEVVGVQGGIYLQRYAGVVRVHLGAPGTSATTAKAHAQDEGGCTKQGGERLANLNE